MRIPIIYYFDKIYQNILFRALGLVKVTIAIKQDVNY